MIKSTPALKKQQPSRNVAAGKQPTLRYSHTPLASSGACISMTKQSIGQAVQATPKKWLGLTLVYKQTSILRAAAQHWLGNNSRRGGAAANQLTTQVNLCMHVLECGMDLMAKLCCCEYAGVSMTDQDNHDQRTFTNGS